MKGLLKYTDDASLKKLRRLSTVVLVVVVVLLADLLFSGLVHVLPVDHDVRPVVEQVVTP